MEPILDEIRATFECGIWYPVVLSTLMLPDACGAVEFSGTAIKPRERYQNWYDEWVLPHYNPRAGSPTAIKFDGEVVYRVRNAMLHETTAFVRGVDGFDRILFTPPNRRGITMDWTLSGNPADLKENAFQVSIQLFFEGVEKGVIAWLEAVRFDTDDRRRKALARLIQLHPEGVDPHIVGIPIVA